MVSRTVRMIKSMRGRGVGGIGGMRGASFKLKIYAMIGVFAGGLLLTAGLAVIGALRVYDRLRYDPSPDTVAEVSRLLGWGAFGIAFLALAVIAAGAALASTTLKEMSASIGFTVHRLKDNSFEIHAASKRIGGAAGELARASRRHASALTETSAAVHQMAGITSQNAKCAQWVLEISKTSQEAATRGKTVVTQMIKSMDEVQVNNDDTLEQMDLTNSQLSGIISVINNIGLKTKVINEIVFQTRLLSFNASVEAERAGENGLGFAVVADEIGKLAAMSGEAADEISKLLADSAARVGEIIESAKVRIEGKVSGGKEKVEASVRVAQECGIVLDEIVFNISKLGKMAKDITSGSRDQEAGANEVVRALEQLDKVAALSSRIAEQSTEATEFLGAQADSLEHTVKSLEGLIEGKRMEDESVQPASPQAAVVQEDFALEVEPAA